jgi:hypothetical protein
MRENFSRTSLENKILKNKKLDKETILNITQNSSNNRIFVEFKSENSKIVLQKTFPGTYQGKVDAEEFSKTIKSIDDLKKYFGLKK